MTERAKQKSEKPTFFASPSELRAWLEAHHADRQELWVGFYKRGSGKRSITWPESVDEALCFGWIDGVRKSIDYVSYKIRFTPRKPTSKWSNVNVNRVAELERLGRMRPAGTQAFERRSEARSGVYSYEQRHLVTLDAAHEKLFRANERAWRFFEDQAPWYRKVSTWWVVSAKRDETQAKRLALLIECSADGRRIPMLTRPPAKKKSRGRAR